MHETCHKGIISALMHFHFLTQITSPKRQKSEPKISWYVVVYCEGIQETLSCENAARAHQKLNLEENLVRNNANATETQTGSI